MGEALTQWLPDFLVYRSVSYNYVVVISTTKLESSKVLFPLLLLNILYFIKVEIVSNTC